VSGKEAGAVMALAKGVMGEPMLEPDMADTRLRLGEALSGNGFRRQANRHRKRERQK
jgi:hypothetical protein